MNEDNNVSSSKRPSKNLTNRNRSKNNHTNLMNAAVELKDSEQLTGNEIEMRRDREYRTLNEKLREKEYRLRELEAEKLEQNKFNGSLAKKIEQDVLQRLTQSTALGKLLQSNDTEKRLKSNESTVKGVGCDKITPKRSTTKGSSPATSQSINNGGNRPHRTESTPKRSEPRASGGLIRVPWLSLKENDKLDYLSGKMDIGGDKGPVSSSTPPPVPPQTQRGIYGIRPMSMPVCLMDPTKSSLQVEIERETGRVRQLETAFQRTFEELRKNKDAVCDFCVLGPTNGSPELSRLVGELEALFMDQLRRQPFTLVNITAANRLWALRHKQLELFLGLLNNKPGRADRGGKASASSKIDDQQQLLQVRRMFLGELSLTADVMRGVCEELERVRWRLLSEFPKALSLVQWEGPGPLNLTPNADELRVASQHQSGKEGGGGGEVVVPYTLFVSLCEAMQTVYGARGDLIRYQQTYHRTDTDTDSAIDPTHFHSPSDWCAAEIQYEGGVAVAPWVGAGHKALAAVCRSRGDTYGTIYHLFRSMTVKKPYHARETLLDLFEKERQSAEGLETTNALSALSSEEHKARFKAHMLSCLSIAYSRSGADRFMHHVERVRRHLASVLQNSFAMSSTSSTNNNTGNRSGNGSGVNNFYSMNTFSTAFETNSNTNVNDGNEAGHMIAGGVSEMVSVVAEECDRAMVMAVALAHLIAEKYELKTAVSAVRWADAGVTVGQEWGGDLETQMKLKRFTAMTLHVLQSTPGLLDVWHLLLNLLCVLLGADSLSLGGSGNISGSTASVQTVSAAFASASAVSLFWEWFRANPEFHGLILVDRVSWQQVESGLQGFWSSISSIARGKSTEFDSRLGVDVDLAGFIPVSGTVICNSVENQSEQPNCGGSCKWDRLDRRALLVHIARIKISLQDLAGRNIIMGGTSGVVFSSSNRLAMSAESVHRNINEDSKTSSDCLRILTLACLDKTKAMKLTDKVQVLQGFEYRTPKLLSLEEFNKWKGTDNQETRTMTDDADVLGVGEDVEDDHEVAGESEDSDQDSSDIESDVDGELSFSGEPSTTVPSEDVDRRPTTVVVTTVVDESYDGHPVSSFSSTDQPTSTAPDNITIEKSVRGGGMLRVTDLAAVLPKVSNSSRHSGRGKTEKQVKGGGDRGGRFEQGEGKSSGSSNMYGALASASLAMTMSSQQGLSLIVVDAPNVAMRHGLNAKFSCAGIRIVLEFFAQAGHKVVSFLPDYYLSYEGVNGIRRQAVLNIDGATVRASRVPDDVNLLQQLVVRGLLIGTPAQDYDDSYCITYARRHGGYVITNDLYRDHIKRVANKTQREETRKWIKSHCVSYTFVGDEFLPNPDANIGVGSSTKTRPSR
eukprot:gene8228-16920_t